MRKIARLSADERKPALHRDLSGELGEKEVYTLMKKMDKQFFSDTLTDFLARLSCSKFDLK